MRWKLFYNRNALEIFLLEKSIGKYLLYKCSRYYFTIEIDWILFYCRQALENILLYKCSGYYFTIEMDWILFYCRQALENILLEKSMGKYSTIKIHCESSSIGFIIKMPKKFYCL